MVDTPSIAPADTNPSQTGGPGFTAGAPVNGTATPPAEQQPNTEVPSQDQPNSETPKQDAPKAQEPSSEPPKVDEVPSVTGEDGAVVYDETGDAGLDLALSFIGKLGITGTDPAMVAAANGDFTFLEAKLSTLGDEARGWEKHIQLGKEAFGRQLYAYKAEQGKTLSAVHSVVGGEANWKNLVAWAGKEATPDEKAALNAMFDAGPIQARMAAQSILAAYQSAKGTTINPANPASAASGAAPVAPKIMSRQDYAKEVDALYKKLGNRMDNSPEYNELKSRFFGR